MDPLNDLVWTDEEESDVLLKAIEGGPGMAQTCQISVDSCSSSGNDGINSCIAGAFGNGIPCGC